MSPTNLAFFVAFTIGASACAAGPSTPRPPVARAAARPSADELVERGRAFALVSDVTRAEQYFAAALDAGADPRRTLPLLLQVCIEAKRYRVASDYIDQQLRRDPEDVGLRLLHGMLEAAVGDRQVAFRDYELVLKKRPDDPEGQYAMAVLLRDDLDDAAAADEHFRAYLRLSPDGVHSADARASLLERVP